MDFIQGNKHLSIDPSGIIIKGNDTVKLLNNGLIIGDETVVSNIYPIHVEKHYSDSELDSAYYIKPASASQTSDEIFHTNESLWDISIYANAYIRTSGGILIDSDNRIKKDIEDVPDNFALFQVNNIETKYYNILTQKKKEIIKLLVLLHKM